jgi:hypothetical protein
MPMTITKPIEKIYVYFPGERAAGLRSRSYTLECWVDPSAYDENEVSNVLKEIKEKVASLYELLDGETKPQILFDFECDGEGD